MEGARDRPSQGEHADQPLDADRPNEHHLGDSRGKDPDKWVDPRDVLSPEDRARFYSRTHEAMSPEELPALEAKNIELYGVPAGWDDPDTFDDWGHPDELGDRDQAADASGGGRDSPPATFAADGPDEEPGHRHDMPDEDDERKDAWAEADTDQLPDDPSGEELLEPNDEGKSRSERFRENAAKPEVIEGAHDVGGRIISTFEDLYRDRPQSTGAVVGTADQPVVHQAPRDGIDGGALATLPFLALVMVHQAIRSVQDRSEPRNQERVEQTDASD